MESPDLNSSSDEDAQLAGLLHAHAPAVRDDGFSSRVLVALPPVLTRGWTQMALLWAGTGTMVGLVFVLLHGASGSTGSNTINPQLLADETILRDPWLGLGIAISGLSVLLTLGILRTGGVVAGPGWLPRLPFRRL